MHTPVMDELLEAFDPIRQVIRTLVQLCISNAGDNQHVTGIVIRLQCLRNQVLFLVVLQYLIHRSRAVSNRDVNGHLHIRHLRTHPNTQFGWW